MFTPKTPKISNVAINNEKVIKELESLLTDNIYVYIDYANVRPWSSKLNWHIHLKRLKQFLDSFDNIGAIKFYSGTLMGDGKSEKEIEEIQQYNYSLRTKPVKIMHFSIDARGISSLEDKSLLQRFIRSALLRKYTGETIEYLNQRFLDMNKLGEITIEDRKCNFDVEIGVDMLLDAEREKVNTFVLWSGDSDFYDPIQKLLQDDKKVILFATSRRVSRELNKLRNIGLIIFDIKKIQDFICWNKEMTNYPTTAKELPEGNSKQ